jgi:hypothetical protein
LTAPSKRAFACLVQEALIANVADERRTPRTRDIRGAASSLASDDEERPAKNRIEMEMEIE